MPTSLYKKFGNNNPPRNNNNILLQLLQLQNNPGGILDILLRNGKINQQQYNDLQRYRNNPEAIGRYLINAGKGNELSQAEKTAKQMG